MMLAHSGYPGRALHAFTRRRSPALRGPVGGLAARAAEHARYLSEVAMVPATPLIDALVHTLQAQGQRPTSPSARQGLHPLLVPLAEQPGGALSCLLRWPEGHPGM
jgi:hypothetical protein